MPRKRLSLYTHRTLSHDVSAALKASGPLTIRTTSIEPTPAPPPSPVDSFIEAKKDNIVTACDTQDLDGLISLATEREGLIDDGLRQKACK